ncbi:MAG TPA: regulatory protein RecX [Dehalococcoidia bacterium]|nr:regulatory protein RecX [Dehalococcoidia bacterium]
MPTITSIEKQKRRPRGDVYVDGVLALTLRLDLIVTAGLSVGSEFTNRVRRELEAEDQRLEAINQALRLLSLVPRSEKELRDRLRRRAYRPAAIDAAIGRMRELGYLNDTAFARGFVEARQSSTPRSKRALAFELTRKGVDRETASEAVAELSDADAAYEAAQRRLRALRGLDRQSFTRRLGSFLASRGFGYGVARAAIDRCYQEMRALEEEPAAD